MGDVKQQNLVVEAMTNMKETWNELLDLAEVKDENAPLQVCEMMTNANE